MHSLLQLRPTHLNVKPELAELVPPERELLRGGPVGDGLQPLRNLRYVVVRIVVLPHPVLECRIIILVNILYSYIA